MTINLVYTKIGLRDICECYCIAKRKELVDVQHLKQYFKSEKCKSYRPIPFWSWNDKLEPEELIRQIQWMNKNGMGGFFMHARSGLQTDYMSEEWMHCIEVCSQEAQNLGMQAWAYDENGWPSGFAGGKLLEDEENRDQYILHTIGAYDEEATVSYLITDTQMLRVGSGEQEGEYLNLYIKVSVSTADILNPEVVSKFITLTHERYKERFGDKFSQEIEGFFTDEPQYYRPHTPYTVMVEQYWKENYNEDILDSLGLLFVEKEGYRKFRYRYWKAMQELMLNAFAKMTYNWCEENGVKLTGHYVEENSLGYQMTCCAGVMPFYEYEHIPGIDSLGAYASEWGAIPSKQVGSAAVQLGKKRVMTETFGCCGWDISPIDLKRLAGLQYVNGVNMMCHHLIPYTERGNRKYDHPAHYSDVNPWVKEEYKSFNDYFTRLGYLLGEGKQHVNVALFHPIRSAYFNYKRELDAEQGFGVLELDDNLRKTCRLLASHSVDYHFVDETLLAKYGTVQGGKLGCGQCTYEYLVFPDVITMDKSTEKLLHSFVEQGGKVLMLGRKPSYVEADEYAYNYLESNCTLAEIIAAQPFRTTIRDTELYTTYRTMEEHALLYVTNNSADVSYTQTFDFGGEVHSFVKWNLLDGTMQRVPLTITLKPGEDAILIPDKKCADVQNKLAQYELRFEHAEITWKQNYLPVDYISYSKDGVEFSKPWPCAALFQKLLKEHHEGQIYLKYEFDVDVIPKEIFVRAEKNRTDVRAWFNGTLLTEELPAEVFYAKRYDISKLVRKGKNEYILEMNWHEDELVYYALFGENVTESLRNCIVYDSELQPIQIEGRFGVYPQTGYYNSEDGYFIKGDHFYIGDLPDTVSDIVVDGFPFLAGDFILKQDVLFDSSEVLLSIPGNYHVAEVTVNGDFAGKLLFEKELDISHVAVKGENAIEVKFTVSNRNLYGPHHYGGFISDGITPWTFELYNTWDEDESYMYRKDYSFKKFYE